MDQTHSGISKTFVLAVVCFFAGATLLTCSGSESASSGSDGEAAVIGDDEVLATIGNTSITMADVRGESGEQLDQIEHQYLRQRHDVLEETLQEMLRDRLLQDEANKRGVTVFELLQAEVDSKLAVGDQDIADWYEENRGQVRGRNLEELTPQIEKLLRDERRTALTDSLVQRLWTERGVAYHLEPFRVDLDNEGSPALGPLDASITLVEFSDFECPFCGRFFPTLKRLKETYGDSLRIVYRQFPLPQLHPNAIKAAEASLCAHDQGKFWEMHDLLFEQQDRLTVKDLKENARWLGLDAEEFDTCLDSGRHAQRIEADLQEGRSVGVTGTPALFVNGILVPGGAVPYETVARHIDEELRRVGG